MKIIGLFFILAVTFAKNILLTNDDSWVSANIRATYNHLKAAGHNVILAAPVSQRSGWSGKFDVPSSNTLETDGEFGYVKAGAPSWGHEVDDGNIWYFNGTPASCVAFALKYVIPQHFNNISIDLVVSGPNEGTNMSPGMFTISGTIGATYNAVYRGIPAIAFSGSVGNNSFFKDADFSDEKQYYNIYAKLTTDLVTKIFKQQGKKPRALPLSTGLNVNFPLVGYSDENCTNPKWVHTRLTGEDAATLDLEYDASTNSFKSTSGSYDGLYKCYNGDCSFPSENYILGKTYCQTAVSVFSTDYDANKEVTDKVIPLIL